MIIQSHLTIPPKVRDGSARSKLQIDVISLNRRRWPWFFGEHHQGRSAVALTKDDRVIRRLTKGHAKKRGLELRADDPVFVFVKKGDLKVHFFKKNMEI